MPRNAEACNCPTRAFCLEVEAALFTLIGKMYCEERDVQVKDPATMEAFGWGEALCHEIRPPGPSEFVNMNAFF